MSTSFEQGHEKNVANLGQLITECKTLGALYVPSNENLTLAKLADLATRAKASLVAQGSAKTDLDMATNARATIFETLPKLATRIFRAARASGFTEKDLADVQEHIRRLRGERASASKTKKAAKAAQAAAADTPTPADATPTDAPTPATNGTVSAAQKGFDNQIKHLRELVDGLAKNPLYKPNEDSLKTETLIKVVADLETKNEKCKEANAALFGLRQQRDTLLYADGTGLCAIVQAVKDYVMSAENTPKATVSRIRRINFRNLVR